MIVCPRCGNRNEDKSETCARCSQALMKTAVPDCRNHPDEVAVTHCVMCDAPLCEACRVLVSGSSYCAEDAEQVRGQAAERLLENAPVLNVAERSPASAAQRIQAGLMDAFILTIGAFIVYLLFWVLAGDNPLARETGAWANVYWTLVVLTTFVYFLGGGLVGQTSGKTAASIMVLREDGRLLDVQTAAARSVLAILGFLALGAGFWPIVWRPDRKAFHDIATHTVVVQE